MTIFALKLKDPSAVFLNRGNHEMLETNILCPSKAMSSMVYGGTASAVSVEPSMPGGPDIA